MNFKAKVPISQPKQIKICSFIRLILAMESQKLDKVS